MLSAYSRIVFNYSSGIVFVRVNLALTTVSMLQHCSQALHALHACIPVMCSRLTCGDNRKPQFYACSLAFN